MLQRLLDITIKVPDLLQQVDLCEKMSASHNGLSSAEVSSRRAALSTWARSLRNELHDWKRHHADMYPGGQPREMRQAADIPVFRQKNKEGDITTPLPLTYPDLVMALSLCTYNAVQIVLFATSLIANNNDGGVLPYARDICRSVQFFMKQLPLFTLIQLEFPLRVAHGVLAGGSLERQYIQEVARHIYEHRKLRIFSSILYTYPATL